MRPEMTDSTATGSTKKRCPFTKNVLDRCKEEDCALWIEHSQCCAFKEIASQFLWFTLLKEQERRGE